MFSIYFVVVFFSSFQNIVIFCWYYEYFMICSFSFESTRAVFSVDFVLLFFFVHRSAQMSVEHFFFHVIQFFPSKAKQSKTQNCGVVCARMDLFSLQSKTQNKEQFQLLFVTAFCWHSTLFPIFSYKTLILTLGNGVVHLKSTVRSDCERVMTFAIFILFCFFSSLTRRTHCACDNIYEAQNLFDILPLIISFEKHNICFVMKCCLCKKKKNHNRFQIEIFCLISFV